MGRRGQHGFTLIEVTIILLVLTVLSSIMLPQMGNFNRLARFVKVREDLGAICSVLKMMIDDVGTSGVYADRWGDRRRAAPVGLLVGGGAVPLVDTDEAAAWELEYGAEFAVTTDGGDRAESFAVDRLANHLLTNTPLGDGGRRWPTALDQERGINARFQWRGPYMDELGPDPWGNRYMVNSFALHTPPSAGPFEHYGSGVVCLSAGPDAAVDTAFNQPVGWTTGGDDLVALLHAGGTM